MFAAILLELTLAEVIGDLPHDAGAILVYVLLALFIGSIWHGSRRKSAGASASSLSVGASPAASAATPPAD
jgi:hypothetical protein